MTRMTEKSNYSIQNLQESLRDVMEGEFTPQEIHEVIIDTVKDNMRYYRACYNDSVRLLALLRGNSNNEIKVYDSNDESPEAREEFNKFWTEDVPEWRRIEDPNYNEESHYWKGELYGKEFNDALRKYGYEYTPIDKSKFKLDSPELHNNED